MNESRPSDLPTIFLLVVAMLRKASDLPRSMRRIMALGIDLALCILSVWLAFSIRIGAWDLFSPSVGIVIAIAIPAWLISARWCGVYRSIIRSAGGRSMIDLAIACFLFSLPMVTIFMFVGIASVPRTIGVLQPMIFMLLLAMGRLAIRYALIDILQVVERKRGIRVAIYGAGRAGQQLGMALHHEANVSLICYLDDDDSLVGQRIDGVKIHSSRDIGDIFERLGLDEIFLALPSVARSTRAKIVEQLQSFPLRVRSVPSIGNIIDGKVSIKDLHDVAVEDLLGRDPVPPDENLLSEAIFGKVVLVSGAGGSIGSELCRQIFARAPKRLILVDHSEFALYSILTELDVAHDDGPDIEVIPELADIAEAGVATRIMGHYRPQTVFHAAAYKHVPLVEANPISGLKNNILGTYHCSMEAERVGTSRFILVSTDKAVRPTNVMGASKRICELILQARALIGHDTVFSMVRFGNVLGSSGSVVPRFRAQIAAGGPVQLTHREMTRFFMTIPEAAQLVMQAGAMAKGGEVFVLDMGQPVRILDLACSMIQLSGRTIRDDMNPDGDIEIEEIGLRPGEKMYEELLLGDNPQSTSHSRIMRAQEAKFSWTDLAEMLDELMQALDASDVEGAMTVVRRAVPDYAIADRSADKAPFGSTRNADMQTGVG